MRSLRDSRQDLAHPRAISLLSTGQLRYHNRDEDTSALASGRNALTVNGIDPRVFIMVFRRRSRGELVGKPCRKGIFDRI